MHSLRRRTGGVASNETDRCTGQTDQTSHHPTAEVALFPSVKLSVSTIILRV